MNHESQTCIYTNDIIQLDWVDSAPESVDIKPLRALFAQKVSALADPDGDDEYACAVDAFNDWAVLGPFDPSLDHHLDIVALIAA
jgi:hypothetical protein